MMDFMAMLTDPAMSGQMAELLASKSSVPGGLLESLPQAGANPPQMSAAPGGAGSFLGMLQGAGASGVPGAAPQPGFAQGTPGGPPQQQASLDPNMQQAPTEFGPQQRQGMGQLTPEQMAALQKQMGGQEQQQIRQVQAPMPTSGSGMRAMSPQQAANPGARPSLASLLYGRK